MDGTMKPVPKYSLSTLVYNLLNISIITITSVACQAPAARRGLPLSKA